ncbi:lipoprotein [Floccifex sp.]|uniref:lipoprotein n=1 Tax=Floccifex sp. TaxID=2815810 RepID=UPI003F056B57
MKKVLMGALAVVLLAGCSSSGETGTFTGETTSDESGTTTVEVTKEDGKVTDVSIDTVKDGQSKKELGDDYGMRSASAIGKEWNEQIEFLEDYIVDNNGVDGIELDSEGKATNEDVLAGCTINIKDVIVAYNSAK